MKQQVKWQDENKMRQELDEMESWQESNLMHWQVGEKQSLKYGKMVKKKHITKI
jgi:hypothetical protein